MNKDLRNDFISSLIQKTLNYTLSWLRLSTSDNKSKDMVSACLEFCNTYCHEFHGINIDESYAVSCKQGYIYLLNEWFESGKEGDTFINDVLYIQSNIGAPMYEITTTKNDENIYRLINAITTVIKQSEPNAEVEQFITDFLND